MWSLLGMYVALCAVVFSLVVIITTAVRNRRAQQFFMKLSPNLPVVPNAGIFGGHMNQIWLAKRNWEILGELHKKYGKTIGSFYCDKPFVSTIDLNLIKAMVLDNPNDHVNRMRANTPVLEVEQDCVFTTDEEQWRRLRRSIAPAFTKTKFMMPNVQLEVELVIDKLIRSFENRLDRAKLERSEKFVTLDFEEMSLRYAIALVLTCFYKQDEVVDFEGETDRFTQIIESALRNTINPALRFCVMFPLFIPIVNWLLQFHPTGKMRNVLMSFVRQQTSIGLKARQQVGRAATNFNKTNAPGAGHTFDSDNFLLDDGTKFRRNMIDYIIDQFHDGKLTKSEYLNNTFFLFLAASKTSADAICKMIYNLAANQDEQDKLRAAVVSDGPDSEYLHWSIFESMRLFPPGPAGCSRRLSSDLETEDGVKIPAGTMVYTPPNIIHRLKEYWGPDANEYNPERWRHSASFHPAQFMGFGLGKRNCFGGQFAVSEIKMLMSKLLARYKFNLAADTNAQTIKEFDTFLIFTSSDLPTNIEISRV